MQEIPIVILGHKDHGKSTLIGRILFDTSSIKSSRVEEIKEADKSWGRPFEFAHLVDSFREEREREMTMDTTRMRLKGKKRNYELIDVPGHKELISQMLTGASAADAALLVVSIKEGTEEQTREHLEIAKLLGIEKLGVIINKMDTISYEEPPFREITQKLNNMLAKIGYLPTKLTFIPVSASQGENIINSSEKMAWYQGISVLEYIESEFQEIKNLESGHLRFLVQDVYPINKENISVGRIESGKLKTGEVLLFSPGNKKAKIAAILRSDHHVANARAGENIGLILNPRIDIQRGAVGSRPPHPQAKAKLKAEVFFIEAPVNSQSSIDCGTASAGIRNINPVPQGHEKKIYTIVLDKEITCEPRGKTILSKIAVKDKGRIVGVGNIEYD